jgi:hypothetical protein
VATGSQPGSMTANRITIITDNNNNNNNNNNNKNMEEQNPVQ